MSIDLHGRVVAVTGASSGIGEATALACAKAGAAALLVLAVVVLIAARLYPEPSFAAALEIIHEFKPSVDG